MVIGATEVRILSGPSKEMAEIAQGLPENASLDEFRARLQASGTLDRSAAALRRVNGGKLPARRFIAPVLPMHVRGEGRKKK